MGAMEFQIASLTNVSSGADQIKLRSFVWGILPWPVNSPHNWPVTPKMFPFDDIIMYDFLYFDVILYLPCLFVWCSASKTTLNNTGNEM